MIYEQDLYEAESCPHYSHLEQEYVKISKDIPRFCKESGIPIALDESVDEDTSFWSEMLERIASEGVMAVVIFPGRVGSFEQAVSLRSGHIAEA
ncbi:protein PHYLLO, chloroplastic-like isoform X1 [Physcomitrium patens]|uniref:protein PHYLLO, chloroplastic-like isoform X1 n=1 Tax=Physcomitrium patens TaxID=3218 RepID=UPI003CCC9112